eukprot:6492574-Amphidinium_carterae.8
MECETRDISAKHANDNAHSNGRHGYKRSADQSAKRSYAATAKKRIVQQRQWGCVNINRHT